MMIMQYSPPMSTWEVAKLMFPHYKTFLRGIFQSWEWGRTNGGFDAWELLLKNAKITLLLNFLSFFIYVPLGILFGIVSAIKKNQWIDKGIALFTLVFSSIPSFVLAFAMILFFGYELEWLPPMYPVIAYSLEERILGFVIPVFALSIGPIATFTRLVKGELLETFNHEYLLLARTKGLNQRQVIFRHAFRNSAVALMPELSKIFIVVLSGSFFIEYIYNVQGVAWLFFDSLFQPYLDANQILIDTNMVVLIALFYSSIALVVSLISDLLYAWIDPRMKIGQKRMTNN
jgi:ABC-type dipeptide/oligopeptide/nickel transport system permease component